jgi:hypothetical protein
MGSRRRYQEASILIAERMPSGAARAANATVCAVEPLCCDRCLLKAHGLKPRTVRMAGVSMVRPAPGCLPRSLVRGRQGRARRGTAQAGGGAIGPQRSRNPFTPFSGRTWVAPLPKQEEYAENAVESLELAGRLASSSDRRRMLKLAEAWVELANGTHDHRPPHMHDHAWGESRAGGYHLGR